MRSTGLAAYLDPGYNLRAVRRRSKDGAPTLDAPWFLHGSEEREVSDTPITRERLLRILDGQAAKTRSVLAGLEEVQLLQPARDDGWTAVEILAHMAWGHEGMLACVLDQAPGGQDESAFDLDAYNEARRQAAADMPAAEVLAWLDEARGRVRALIEQVDEARYQEMVHTPWMGDHPLGQFLMFPALHEGGHRTQLAAWRASLGESGQ